MGIPLKTAFDQFPHVFLPEATGDNGRQREYRSKLLLTFSLCFLTGGNGRHNMGIPLKIAFDKLPYAFLPEAMGGNGNTARASHCDLNSLFLKTQEPQLASADWGIKP